MYASNSNILLFLIHSGFPVKFFSPVVAISNALFNKTIRPAAQSTPPSATQIATSVNKSLMSSIKQQTPNSSPMRVRSSAQTHDTNHTTSHRNHR